MSYSLNLSLKFPILNHVENPQIFTKNSITDSSIKAFSPDGKAEYFRTYLDSMEDAVYECDKYLVAVKDHEVLWFRRKSEVRIKNVNEVKEEDVTEPVSE